MKISGTTTTSAAAPRRSRKGAKATGENVFRVAMSNPPSEAMAAPAVTTASAISPLLALQEVGDPLDKTKRALHRGHQLLDQLDRIRHALLLGSIGRQDLDRLSQAIGEERLQTADPNLASVLDEIDLRAKVEIAKFERPHQ